MTRTLPAAGLLLAILGACSEPPEPIAPALPGEGEDTGKTVIYRDTWGIPHIYAPTVEAGLFAQGWAQAEDRPAQLLVNLKIALGELAEVTGADGVRQDLLSRLFDHHGNAERTLASMEPSRRARLEAFAAGINAFYAAHPDDVPPFWQHPRVTPPMIDAFGRMFLYNWSIDEALEDLERGGVTADFVTEARGSNQWAVSPSRTTDGNALLLIDPHLSWWGPSRFWEMRVHAGEWHGSGVGLAGSPYIGLGHNASIAWAMTTGGPDTADVYRLTLDPDNHDRYRYDGTWRDLATRTVTLKIRDAEPRTFTLRFSHHGPIIAQDGDAAYAAAVPYTSETDRNAAWEKLNFAADYRGAVDACATLAMFPQNVMVADTAGNIYYQRTGRVPVRPQEYDWSRPVDGSTSATEWRGIHPASDHLQVLNPAQGYLQNCNIPPDAMTQGSLFKPEAFLDYLYSGPGYGPARSGWTNQRGARALELLSTDDDVTIEEALAWAVDTKPFGVERWLSAIGAAFAGMPDGEQWTARLGGWDGRLERDSRAALVYAYWRHELERHTDGARITALIDDHYAIVEAREPEPAHLADPERAVLRETLAAAIRRLDTEAGPDATYGDVFRVGRDDRSWPVGGGGGDEFGLTTLRSMGYAAPDAQFRRAGNRGQTSTQLVVLSNPIQSFIYLPVGQSDRPESPHYDDQAEHLFSERRLKPSWWLPADLAPHIASRIVLQFPDARAAPR